MTDRALEVISDVMLVMCVDQDKSLVIVTPKYLVDETSLIENSVVVGDWIVFTSDSHEYTFSFVTSLQQPLP